MMRHCAVASARRDACVGSVFLAPSFRPRSSSPAKPKRREEEAGGRTLSSVSKKPDHVEITQSAREFVECRKVEFLEMRSQSFHAAHESSLGDVIRNAACSKALGMLVLQVNTGAWDG